MYSHYTALLYGIPAVCGQGTWICPTFTALMGLSVLTQAKAREEYRGKQVVVEITNALEFFAFARSLFVYLNMPFNFLSGVYLAFASTAVQAYTHTFQVGIPGRVAYMVVHATWSLATVALVANLPPPPGKLLELLVE